MARCEAITKKILCRESVRPHSAFMPLPVISNVITEDPQLICKFILQVAKMGNPQPNKILHACVTIYTGCDFHSPVL